MKSPTPGNPASAYILSPVYGNFVSIDGSLHDRRKWQYYVQSLLRDMLSSVGGVCMQPGRLYSLSLSFSLRYICFAYVLCMRFPESTVVR